MYKACIFDMDGTVLNTLDSIAYFGNEALKHLGFAPIPTQAYRQMVGNGADCLMERMLAHGGNPNEAKEALRKEYDRLYEADPLKLVQPYPGIMELVLTLKRMGLRLGILSNKPDNVTCSIAEEIFPDIFDKVQGQRENVPTKPDPITLLQMMRTFSVSAQETVYCGDSGVDMQTGRNAEVYTVGVCWGFRTAQELEENGADCLVQTADELLEIIHNRT